MVYIWPNELHIPVSKLFQLLGWKEHRTFSTSELGRGSLAPHRKEGQMQFQEGLRFQEFGTLPPFTRDTGVGVGEEVHGAGLRDR